MNVIFIVQYNYSKNASNTFQFNLHASYINMVLTSLSIRIVLLKELVNKLTKHMLFIVDNVLMLNV